MSPADYRELPGGAFEVSDTWGECLRVSPRDNGVCLESVVVDPDNGSQLETDFHLLTPRQALLLGFGLVRLAAHRQSAEYTMDLYDQAMNLMAGAPANILTFPGTPVASPDTPARTPVPLGAPESPLPSSSGAPVASPVPPVRVTINPGPGVSLEELL